MAAMIRRDHGRVLYTCLSTRALHVRLRLPLARDRQRAQTARLNAACAGAVVAQASHARLLLRAASAPPRQNDILFEMILGIFTIPSIGT